ncbi:DUF6395 domain-containing protein [Oceanirhabdus seepicola]|uniref:Uncharacterized protein n=1 Tax=Oceanirhabdus seepicola TaxID=2828781 RepID=A0A9J6P174_9CLOT|nr:DUF6395 domain-containing protein [Oceanirhabdus seepicola]MCM1990275.1 hypothetical protein [Oceanirhabdus seepicola]
MKIDIIWDSGRLKFSFIPEDGDGDFSEKARLGNTNCFVKLPSDWSLEGTHPDIIALATILIIYPFSKYKINLPFGVSKDFAELFEKVTKKKVFPIVESLKPRKSQIYSVPALAYSGGVDSTAALAVLPNTAKLFFLDRKCDDREKNSDNKNVVYRFLNKIKFNRKKNTLYDKDAAYFACESLKNMGRSVYMIESNLEYVRNPVGFPIDVANSIPAILMADYIGLDSIAFGTILESSYRIGHEKYLDYSKRTHYIRWGKLFEIVGLPFNQVTAGISEVGTSKIVINSPYSDLAQSCMRGKAQTPCLNCWKCFRKVLLDKTLKDEELDDKLFEKVFKIREATEQLSKNLIKHQNVLQYITYHYNGSNENMVFLKDKVMGEENVDWLEKWYPKSIELIPEKYKDVVEKNILKYLEKMSTEEEIKVEQWNLGELVKSENHKMKCEKFTESING